MINSQIFLLAFLFIASTQVLSAQEPDPYAIIDSTRKILDQVQDYQADIEIEVDVEFINMPVKHATIYYKKPDKVKFKSDEFIMLPKRGVSNRITEILEEPFTAIYIGQELLNGEQHHVIRIVPMGKNPEVILATWWINSQRFLVARNESNTKKDGQFTVDFKYDDKSIILPTQMTFSFEVEKLQLPLKFIGKSSGIEIDKSKMEEAHDGKVYLRFSNYVINSNYPDDFFEEQTGEDDTN